MLTAIGRIPIRVVGTSLVRDGIDGDLCVAAVAKAESKCRFLALRDGAHVV